jgi:hypothetical protein
MVSSKVAMGRIMPLHAYRANPEDGSGGRFGMTGKSTGRRERRGTNGLSGHRNGLKRGISPFRELAFHIGPPWLAARGHGSPITTPQILARLGVSRMTFGHSQ